MSERFVSEYVEIIDENGSRQVVCVTDNKHTVSFEVKDEYVAMDLAKKLNEQQATITKLEQICEKKMQEIENIKYSLKEIAYKYQKEVQFKTDTDPNQAVKEVLCEQQATISRLEEENEQLKNKLNKGL